MNFSSIYNIFILCIFFRFFQLISSYGKLHRSFGYVNIYCVGAEITTLMSTSEGLDSYLFCRKMERAQSMKEQKWMARCLLPRQSRHFFFIDNAIKVLFPICTLIWRVNNYVSRQGKSIDRRNESIIIII